MKEKIIFQYLTDERRYQLITQSGAPLEEVIKKFLEIHNVDFPLLTEADYKIMWAHRTEINGLLKDLADARKQTTAVVINPLVDACKPLEKMLKQASDELTEKMLAFKPKEEKSKTTSVITIEYPIGSEEINKVEKYLNREKINFKKEEK